MYQEYRGPSPKVSKASPPSPKVRYVDTSLQGDWASQGQGHRGGSTSPKLNQDELRSSLVRGRHALRTGMVPHQPGRNMDQAELTTGHNSPPKAKSHLKKHTNPPPSRVLQLETMQKVRERSPPREKAPRSVAASPAAQVFAKIDLDGNGVIDREEFRKAVERGDLDALFPSAPAAASAASSPSPSRSLQNQKQQKKEGKSQPRRSTRKGADMDDIMPGRKSLMSRLDRVIAEHDLKR